jgi:hypothetical protein
MRDSRVRNLHLELRSRADCFNPAVFAQQFQADSRCLVSCRVSISSVSGLQQSVEVTADSL